MIPKLLKRTAEALEMITLGNTVAEEVLTSEAELISRILAGERELYYDLIAPYQRLVYLSLLSLLRNEADAEDCSQDAFLKALQSLSDFKGESRFSSWLVRIALNEGKMRLRKARPMMYEALGKNMDGDEGDYAPHNLGDWREIPSELLERKEAREALEKAVQSLPPIYQEVFILRDVEGLNVTATAQILAVSEGVVKTRLVRARIQLRDLLFPVLKNSRILSKPSFPRGRNPWA